MKAEPSAYETIQQRALRLIEQRRVNPTDDLGAVRDAAADAVTEYQQGAHLGRAKALADPAEMVARVLRSIVEYGPVTDLLARPDVEQIFIEGARVSYQDTSGRIQGLPTPITEAEARHIVERLLADSSSGRHLDPRSPLVQARVLEGSPFGRARLPASIPPITEHLSAHLRKYALRHETLRSLIDKGSLNP